MERYEIATTTMTPQTAITTTIQGIIIKIAMYQTQKYNINIFLIL
jgi:hypothetical protein